MVSQEHGIDPTDDSDFEKKCFAPRKKEDVHSIELTDSQIRLVSQALDIYTRLGMGQFYNAVKDHPNVERHLFKMEEHDIKKFNDLLLELGYMLHGIRGHGSWGIFNDETGDESVLAAHIHQAIKHHLWKEDKSPDKPMHVQSANPADVWRLAKHVELIIPIKKLPNE